MKRLTFIAIALSFTAAAHAQPPKGYPNCPFDNVQDCEMDASVSRNIELYNSGRYTRPDGTIDFDLMAKDAAADAKHSHAQQPKRQQANQDFRQSVSRENQHFLDHYEPVTQCQPSTIMSARDMQNAWAGVSSGPQGMDCTTVYVPVYR